MFAGEDGQSVTNVKYLRMLLTMLIGLVPLASQAETYLLMAEEAGCIYCARWDREISEIYPLTPEGTAAPLRRFDLRGEVPGDVQLSSKVRFTPTFVLIRDGVEIDRIEGYPGEDFFWGLLGMMLERAGTDQEETG